MIYRVGWYILCTSHSVFFLCGCGLASELFGLSSDRFSHDLLVAFPDVLACFLFVVYRRHFQSFLVILSSGLVLVKISSISVAF